MEYDDHNNMIHYKKTGREEEEKWYEYDENNNCTYFKLSNPTTEYEIWKKYNENGDMIYQKDSKGNIKEIHYKYY